MSDNNISIVFRKGITGDLTAAERREWLITNGLGSFASGTIAGSLTRRYHGLLIAALQPPGGRTLLATKAEEIVIYGGRRHELFTNDWAWETGSPPGYEYISQFHLEGTTPVWTFSIADAQLEKRIWMQPGENSTYVRYEYLDGVGKLILTTKMLVNYRDMHADSHCSHPALNIEKTNKGFKISPESDDAAIFLHAETAAVEPGHQWYENYFLKREEDRGLPDLEDNLFVGTFQWELSPGESVTFIASTQENPNNTSDRSWKARTDYETNLLKKAGPSKSQIAFRNQLLLAADQFIVRRAIDNDPDGRTVIAGYHWFSDWGRDTMIALPGLTLSTGRPEIARKIIQTFSRYISQGMLPNRFPEENQTPEYNTVDAALWYFEAIRAYFEKTQDLALVKELFPDLVKMIEHHIQGTRYQIYVDPKDGLLHAGVPGKQITWMDVKIGDWVVTPRIGKPVEINALWFNALMTIADFAGLLGQPVEVYLQLADQTKTSFQRFWNSKRGYCFDVIDSPDGNDDSLRPNQLFAVSLHHSPLSEEQQKAIVDTCNRNLLTPFGLRSLGPEEPNYRGTYGGDQYQRDSVYHQGTVWGWLIGPFVQAHLRVYKSPQKARTILLPLQAQVRDHGLGTLSEIFEGDPPFEPRGTIAQAWTVAEWLRTWALIDDFETQSEA
jgi:predicted glycogen debranching enzyme